MINSFVTMVPNGQKCVPEYTHKWNQWFGIKIQTSKRMEILEKEGREKI